MYTIMVNKNYRHFIFFLKKQYILKLHLNSLQQLSLKAYNLCTNNNNEKIRKPGKLKNT